MTARIPLGRVLDRLTGAVLAATWAEQPGYTADLPILLHRARGATAASDHEIARAIAERVWAEVVAIAREQPGEIQDA